jgi:hypothetical protein
LHIKLTDNIIHYLLRICKHFAKIIYTVFCVVNRCDPFLEKIKSRIEHNAFESLEVERSGTKRLSKNGAVYVASFSARS